MGHLYHLVLDVSVFLSREYPGRAQNFCGGKTQHSTSIIISFILCEGDAENYKSQMVLIEKETASASLTFAGILVDIC